MFLRARARKKDGKVHRYDRAAEAQFDATAGPVAMERVLVGLYFTLFALPRPKIRAAQTGSPTLL